MSEGESLVTAMTPQGKCLVSRFPQRNTNNFLTWEKETAGEGNGIRATGSEGPDFQGSGGAHL